MHKRYVIHGDLTKFAKKMFEDRRRVWDFITEFKTRISIDLRNQHNSNSLFNGPVGISGTFFLLYPKDVPARKRVNGVVHTQKPPISSLIYFIEHVASGIVFGNGCTIVSVECEKIYTLDNARAELEIFSINKA